MGGACSKKKKPDGNGPTSSMATFNVNEPPSKSSMWKQRIRGDNEEPRNVSWSDPDAEESRNQPNSNANPPKIRKSSIPEYSIEAPMPSAASQPRSLPPPSQRAADEESPPSDDDIPTKPKSQPASVKSSKPSSRPETMSSPKDSENPSSPNSSIRSPPTGSVRSKRTNSSLKKRKSKSRSRSQLASPTTASKTPSKERTDQSFTNSRLDYNPMRRGPTVIELGKDGLNPTKRSSQRMKKSRSKQHQSTQGPNRTSSRIPGPKMREQMLARYNALRDRNKSPSSRPMSPSNHPSRSGSNHGSKSRVPSRRQSTRKSRIKSSRTQSSMPSHYVSRSRSKASEASKYRETVPTVLHAESFTTFMSGRRRHPHHAKDLPTRADYLTAPGTVCRVEFENRNTRLLAGIYRDWENNNTDPDDDSRYCSCPNTSRGASRSLQLSNEVLDRILDSMCLSPVVLSRSDPNTRRCDETPRSC